MLIQETKEKKGQVIRTCVVFYLSNNKSAIFPPFFQSSGINIGNMSHCNIKICFHSSSVVFFFNMKLIYIIKSCIYSLIFLVGDSKNKTNSTKTKQNMKKIKKQNKQHNKTKQPI